MSSCFRNRTAVSLFFGLIVSQKFSMWPQDKFPLICDQSWGYIVAFRDIRSSKLSSQQHCPWSRMTWNTLYFVLFYCDYPNRFPELASMARVPTCPRCPAPTRPTFMRLWGSWPARERSTPWRTSGGTRSTSGTAPRTLSCPTVSTFIFGSDRNSWSHILHLVICACGPNSGL